MLGQKMQTRVQGRIGAPCHLLRPIPATLRQKRNMTVTAAFSPPTVSATKERFLQSYKAPILSIYNNVIQELLVAQHFMKYNANFEYNQVTALGFVSVFDQVLESLDAKTKAAIFAAFMGSIDEDPELYRKDAAQLEALASSLSGPADLVPDASGTPLQQALAKVAAKSSAGALAYNKFVAIGLFRLLELTGAKEPSALERLVKSVGVPQESVNRDLVLYKGILAKLSAAKEMMAEFLVREKRKQAEREAEKAAKAAAKTTAEVAK